MTIVDNAEKPVEAAIATTTTTNVIKEDEEKATSDINNKEDVAANAAAGEAPQVEIKKLEVGSRVAKQFLFFGTVTEVWKNKKGEDHYAVVFDDDDQEDLSFAEIQAAIALYQEKKDKDTKRRNKIVANKRGGKAPKAYRRVSPYPKRG